VISDNNLLERDAQKKCAPLSNTFGERQRKEEGTMSISMKALRWALAIPGGILAAALVMFPVHWVVMNTFGGWGMDPVIEIRDPETLRRIEGWIQAILGPLAFVYCATRIAPSHRKIASIVLAVLVILGSTVLAVWVNAHAWTHRVEFGFVHFLLQVVGVVG
jgi:hypothetical protein